MLLSTYDKVQEKMKMLFKTRLCMSIALSICQPANFQDRQSRLCTAEQRAGDTIKHVLFSDRIPHDYSTVFYFIRVSKERQAQSKYY